jgi:hypothetical protein
MPRPRGEEEAITPRTNQIWGIGATARNRITDLNVK